jgi:hypothetical protein
VKNENLAAHDEDRSRSSKAHALKSPVAPEGAEPTLDIPGRSARHLVAP